MKRFKSSEKEQIVVSYLSGESAGSIAKRLDSCENAVLYQLKVQGIERRNRSLTEREREEILNQHEEGRSGLEIAQCLGRHHGAVTRALRRSDLKILPPGGRRIHSCRDRFFVSLETEAQAYWLGFIAADGNVRKDMRVVTVTLSTRDEEHLQRLRQTLLCTQPLYRSRCGRFVSLQINSPLMAADLTALGVGPAKSASMEFPKLSGRTLQHYMRGFVDGDGTFTLGKSRYRHRFSLVGNVKFVLEFQSALVALTHVPLTKPYFRGNCVTIYYGGSSARKLAEYLYQDATIYLERKRSKTPV